MSEPRQYRDDSLAFDDRRGPPQRRGPAPVTLIVSVLLLLGVVGGVAYLYRDGMRGGNAPPRPVGAPLRDVRTMAPSSPQAADPAAGLSIYKDDPNAAAPPKFAPAPEQPAPRSVDTAPTSVAQTVAPDAAKSEAAKAPAAKAMTIDKLLDQQGDGAAGKLEKAKVADKAKAADKAKVAEEAKANTGDKSIVQIGAFSSEELATKAFHDAARLGGGTMSGKSMRIVPIVKGDATLYRVAATGFTSRGDAEAACDKLKAAGKSCLVR